MAFSGYLIKIGGANGTEFPMKYIKLDGYNITPNQRMESEAGRSVTGLLHRSTVAHTASKIEINTPYMNNTDMAAMMKLFRDNWTSTAERKLTIQYYDMETDTYKEAIVYMPDIKFEIDHIEPGNVIVYKETRIAFIEY